MILNKFKSLLIAANCLWAEPAGASGKSSDSDQSRWSNLALFFGSWVGTTTGSVNKYLDVKMGFPFIIDFELQLSRVAVGFYYGFGLIHRMSYLYDGATRTEYNRDSETTDESMRITLGYAVFNTSYLELQPFIGFGGNKFNNGRDDMDFSTFIVGSFLFI